MTLSVNNYSLFCNISINYCYSYVFWCVCAHILLTALLYYFLLKVLFINRLFSAQMVVSIKTMRERTAATPSCEGARHCQEEVSLSNFLEHCHVTHYHERCLNLPVCVHTFLSCRLFETKTKQRERERQRWLGCAEKRSWLKCLRCKDTLSMRTKNCSSRV